MHHPMLFATTSKERLLRLLAATAVACALAILAMPVTYAVPPSITAADSVAFRREVRISNCASEGGTTTVTDVHDSQGNLTESDVSCYGGNQGNWTCTETNTQSTCSSTVVVPTPTPPNSRAPINPVAALPDSGGQVTPTPLPPLMVDAIQSRTTAEMDRCKAQGGTPTRTDIKAGDDLHATAVQCIGGSLDGTVCAITSEGANCQTATKGQLPKQPVLRIQNPGGQAPSQATPGATPAPTQGTTRVIGGIVANKPGPAKLPPTNTSGIYVSAWTCPVTVNGTSTVDQLKAACKDLHTIDFVLSGTGILTQYPKGDIAQTGLPAGQYTIRELIPNHYGLGQTYCTFEPTGSPPPTVWTAAYNEYDGYYDFTLGESQTVYCDWFNIPEVPYTPTPTPTSRTGTTVITGRNAGLKPEIASTPAG